MKAYTRKYISFELNGWEHTLETGNILMIGEPSLWAITTIDTNNMNIPIHKVCAHPNSHKWF